MTPDPHDADWPAADPAQAASALALDGVHLWRLDLDAPPLPPHALAESLDDDERARAARFHFPDDRRRFEAAHGLLRHVLAGYLGCAPRAIRFAQGPQGKPSLADAPAPAPAPGRLEFNLSHSGGAALLGLAHGRPIGVDLERVRPLSDREGIERSNFAPREVQALQRLPAPRRLDAFFACWTCKEAVVKALGGGLSIPLGEFEVAVDPDRPAALLSLHGSAARAGGWTLWRAQPLPDAWAAAAVALPPGGPAPKRHRL